ncbi:MAG: hypothetical protein KDI44_16620 [Thiothrix sp.]|nr:hypothetical protein [Thiothrix sp.]HPQ94366.1 hypothetical protein [Thiolinea sp.]
MAAFIMAGPVQASGFVLLFAVLSYFLPMLELFSNAAIALVTLRLGWKRGVQVGLVASAGLVALHLLLQAGLWSGLASSLIKWVPVIVLATLLAQQASWNTVLQVILGLATLGVLIFHFQVTDPVTFWTGLLRGVLEQTQLQQLLPDLNLDEMLRQAAPYFSGSLAAGFVLLTVLSLMLARHWQAALYNPGGFRQEMATLRLGRPPALLAIGLITLALVTGQPLLVNLVLVCLAVFLFGGVALIHGLHARFTLHPGWLFGFYAFMLFAPFQMGILLAAFGIIDSLADFRSQLRPRP